MYLGNVTIGHGNLLPRLKIEPIQADPEVSPFIGSGSVIETTDGYRDREIRGPLPTLDMIILWTYGKARVGNLPALPGTISIVVILLSRAVCAGDDVPLSAEVSGPGPGNVSGHLHTRCTIPMNPNIHIRSRNGGSVYCVGFRINTGDVQVNHHVHFGANPIRNAKYHPFRRVVVPFQINPEIPLAVRVHIGDFFPVLVDRDVCICLPAPTIDNAHPGVVKK